MKTISTSINHQNDHSMRLFGDYWTLRILHALQSGSLRFCGLQRAVDDLNPVTLTDRLKKLEGAGVIIRRVGSADSTAVEYQLTDVGEQSLIIIKSMQKLSKQLKT